MTYKQHKGTGILGCYRQHGALKHNLAAIVLIVGGMTALIWSLLPPSYSMDLSQIGRGKPAVVLVYDAGDMSSIKLMENFNPIRGNYDDAIHFLVADVNTPSGGQYAEAKGLSAATTVFYSASGEPVLQLRGLQETAVLTESIREVYGPVSRQ